LNLIKKVYFPQKQKIRKKLLKNGLMVFLLMMELVDGLNGNSI